MSSYIYRAIKISEKTTTLDIYEVQDNGYEVKIYSDSDSNLNEMIAFAKTELQKDYPGINSLVKKSYIDQTNSNPPVNNTKQTATNITTPTPIPTINSPDITSLQKEKEKTLKQINDLQEIGIPQAGKQLVDGIWASIKKKLLTERQIAKKMLLMSTQALQEPMSEEDAQLFIYGKVYYKNGKLYDNDAEDPACVAQPDDDDYVPPIDIENNPMIKKIKTMINDLKESLKQLGIKLGEFLFALPNAIATIAVSLVALVSSAVILPFGSGIPTALSAVQTMVATIKELQSKTSALLPLLAILDTVALFLPKEAQAIIAQINVVYVFVQGILSILNTILGSLNKILSKLGAAKKKMDEQKLSVETKADPSSVKAGENVKLSASATGSNWEFTYEWTDANGNVIGRESDITITPNIPTVINTLNPVTPSTTYTCKVTDGTGTTKTSSVAVKRI